MGHLARHAGRQEADQRFGVAVGLLPVGEVAGRQFDVLGAGHAVGNELGLCCRRGNIVRAANHQHGHADVRQLRAQICIANGCAVAVVAGVRRGQQHRLDDVDAAGVGIA
ncbi:hypothetical protein COLO4_01006, partial [Corchorus olitorius]